MARTPDERRQARRDELADQRYHTHLRLVYFDELHNFQARKYGQGLKVDLERRYPHLDGGPDADGKQHRSLWARLAEKWLPRGLGPDLVLRAVFAQHDHMDPPYPSLFLSEQVPAWAQRYRMQQLALRPGQVQSLLTALSVQTISLLRRGPHKPLTQVLWAVLADAHPHHPLVCYCVAYDAGHQELCDHFCERAGYEYLSDPAGWQQALGTRLPEPFCRWAQEALRPRLTKLPDRLDE